MLIGTTQVVPAEVSSAAYHRGLAEGAEARLGLSTWISPPGRTREDALARAEEGLRAKWVWAKDFLEPAHTTAEIADRLNLQYGSADDIAESVAEHPAFGYAAAAATAAAAAVRLGGAAEGCAGPVHVRCRAHAPDAGPGVRLRTRRPEHWSA